MQSDFLKHVHKGKIDVPSHVPETFLTQRELSCIVVSRIISNYLNYLEIYGFALCYFFLEPHSLLDPIAFPERWRMSIQWTGSLMGVTNNG